MLVSKATGLGKTETFARLPETMPAGMQMVVIAHTRKLVLQAALKIKKRNPHLTVGITMGEAEKLSDVINGTLVANSTTADVIVASVQTFSKSKKKMHAINAANVYWLIIDEAHHATAATYTKIIDYFMGGEQCALVGFTATPNRADGEGLGKVFDMIVYSYGMEDGIDDGWLSPLYAFTVKTESDISKLNAKGDFNEDELADEINNPIRNELITMQWIEYMWPRQTVGFTANIQHAKDLAGSFNRQGIHSEAVWGDDKEQEEKLRALENGELISIFNAQLLTEGWDYPGIEGVILASPTKSQGNVVQKIGRGTRLDQKLLDANANLKDWLRRGLVTEDMKQNLLVMDVVDIFGHHSVATVPSLFGINRNVEMKGQSVGDVAKQIREEQLKNPHIDYSALTDLSKLKTYAREADVWKVRFADEMKGISDMTWIKRGDGGFMLRMPNNQFFKLTGDLTGQFKVEGHFNGKNAGLDKPARTLEEAVSMVEQKIMSEKPDLRKLLNKKEKWRKGAVSEGQMMRLKQLRVPDHVIVKMDSGSAAAYLDMKYAEFRDRAQAKKRRTA